VVPSAPRGCLLPGRRGRGRLGDGREAESCHPAVAAAATAPETVAARKPRARHRRGGTRNPAGRATAARGPPPRRGMGPRVDRQLRSLTAFSQAGWTTPDQGGQSGHPVDLDLRLRILVHWPDMPPAGALRLQDERQDDLWYGCTVAEVGLIIPPPSTRASPADQAHGVKVVQTVVCSTLTPWARPDFPTGRVDGDGMISQARACAGA
jgi:hypothetical protein